MAPASDEHDSGALDELRTEVEQLRERHEMLGADLRVLEARVAPTPTTPTPPRAVPFLGVGLAPGVASTGPLEVPVPRVSASVPAAVAPEQRAAFDPSLLNQLSEAELDALPYGVIVLDAKGRVVSYNDTESRLVGLPREAVLGKNFFSEVAPCARVRAFEGRFQDLAQGRSKLGVETFEFVFHFAKGAQRVLIMISPGRLRGTYNISLIRR
jgi:photoactive yellow protein